jgi:tyrosine-protein kinase Etk/Wzc
VEEASGGLPLLGMIPALSLGEAVSNGNGRRRSGKRARGVPAVPRIESRLVVLHQPKDPVTEAYRALRTSLRFSRMGEPPKSVVITSALPRDGKSTTAANLAVALAQQGSKTLLVDGDLRRGVIAAMFAQPSRPGLSNVLVGDVPVGEAIHQIEVAKSTYLHVLVAGSTPPNPAELIGSQRMEGLLRKLEEHYDAIIIDSAPLNLVTDGAVLGARAGGVILVARASATDRGAVRYASDQLRRVGAQVLGTVLNDVDHARDGYYRTGYGSYQGYYRSYYGGQGKA